MSSPGPSSTTSSGAVVERTEDLAAAAVRGIEQLTGGRGADGAWRRGGDAGERTLCIVHDSGDVEANELRRAATSGLMALTGRADGPPLGPPPGLVAGLDRLADSVTRWSAEAGEPVEVDWGDLLTRRARLLGLRRQGPVSANGTCRLLRGAEGFMAINLPRPQDRAAVDAIVEGRAGADPWQALTAALQRTSVASLVERARLLGVPAAPLGTHRDAPALPWSACPRWSPGERRHLADLRIVDLSSMWAGPLAAMLLSRSGGRPVKVESASRPDGARAVPAFYRTLHPDDQEVVRLDLTTADGRRELYALLDEADVVIESSRPRPWSSSGAVPATWTVRRERSGSASPGTGGAKDSGSGWPSGTTPRWPGGWSSGRTISTRCSAATHWPIRPRAWSPPRPPSSRSSAAVGWSSTSPWRRARRGWHRLGLRFLP